MAFLKNPLGSVFNSHFTCPGADYDPLPPPPSAPFAETPWDSLAQTSALSTLAPPLSVDQSTALRLWPGRDGCVGYQWLDLYIGHPAHLESVPLSLPISLPGESHQPSLLLLSALCWAHLGLTSPLSVS